MASFYIQKRASVKTGWRLMKEEYKEGKRSQSAVPKISWPTLGFTDSMSLEQARYRAQQLNAENSIKRAELASVARIAQRVERDRLHHSAFVPEDLNQQFIKWLDENSSGSDRHREKLRIMWNRAKHVAITLQLTPEQFAANAKKIYRYFSSNEYSLNYTCKVIGVMNQYGIFVGRLIGKYYEQIRAPRGLDREMINDAYIDSDSYYGPSEPLTIDDLNQVKDSLKQEQWNWLFCTAWLGLRPSELDMILEDQKQKNWRLEAGNTDVLWVYQPKLTAKPRHQRWKPIPLIYKEQLKALEIIERCEAAKPLTKTIKRLIGRHVTLYGGRKGFTDLMLDKGHKLEDISQWLGHSSLDMTWAHYKNKMNVSFLKTVK